MNLAAEMPEKLKQMLGLWEEYAAAYPPPNP